MNDNFEEYNNRLKELHKKSPSKTTSELKSLVQRLENENNYNDDNNRLLGDIEAEKLVIVILCFAFAAVGIINFSLEMSLAYYFGLIFFLAGFFIGNTQKYFGLIFLFSHGGTGLGVMIGPLLSEIYDNPLMQDGFNSLHLFLNIAYGIILLAIIISVLRNLSDNFKEKKYSLALPLAVFLIGVTIIEIIGKLFINI